jgi:hypothetical protein
MRAFPYASWEKIPVYLAVLTLLVHVHVLRAAPGSIAGRVIDPHGRPVSNAHVSLSNNERAIVRETISDQDGRFVFGDATRGSYRVSPQVSSFAPVEVELRSRTGRLPTPNYSSGKLRR